MFGVMDPADAAVTLGPMSRTRRLARQLGLEKHMGPIVMSVRPSRRANTGANTGTSAVGDLAAPRAEHAALEHAPVSGRQAQGQLGTHGGLGVDPHQHGGEGRIGQER